MWMIGMATYADSKPYGVAASASANYRRLFKTSDSYLEHREKELLLFRLATHGKVQDPDKLKEAIIDVIENGATPKMKMWAFKIGIAGCSKNWWSNGCSQEIAEKYFQHLKRDIGKFSSHERKLAKDMLIKVLEEHALGDSIYLKITHMVHELERRDHHNAPTMAAGKELLCEQAMV